MHLLRNASKIYRTAYSKKVVLKNCDFQVDDSGCTSVMGPNGCGKSTLARVCQGLEPLTEGSAIEHWSCADMSATMLQDFRSQLVESLSGRQNILIPFGGLHDPEIRKEVALRYVRYVLHKLGFSLDLRRPVGSLSGGEQQALVFARTLLFRPQIWVLDEPASAIDFSRRRLLLQAIWQRSKSCSTLMITHDLNDAILIARRLIVFDSHMNVRLDEIMPEPDSDDLSFRLTEEWATRLRERVSTITHA